MVQERDWPYYEQLQYGPRPYLGVAATAFLGCGLLSALFIPARGASWVVALWMLPFSLLFWFLSFTGLQSIATSIRFDRNGVRVKRWGRLLFQSSWEELRKGQVYLSWGSIYLVPERAMERCPYPEQKPRMDGDSVHMAVSGKTIGGLMAFLGEEDLSGEMCHQVLAEYWRPRGGRFS